MIEPCPAGTYTPFNATEVNPTIKGEREGYLYETALTLPWASTLKNVGVDEFDFVFPDRSTMILVSPAFSLVRLRFVKKAILG